jgi:hypothetical protein
VKREARVNSFWVSVSEPRAVNGDVGMKLKTAHEAQLGFQYECGDIKREFLQDIAWDSLHFSHGQRAPGTPHAQHGTRIHGSELPRI